MAKTNKTSKKLNKKALFTRVLVIFLALMFIGTTIFAALPLFY